MPAIPDITALRYALDGARANRESFALALADLQQRGAAIAEVAASQLRLSAAEAKVALAEAAVARAIEGSPTVTMDATPEVLNQETNARFWAQTNYKPGKKLDMADPHDKAMAKVWKTIYAAVKEEAAAGRLVTTYDHPQVAQHLEDASVASQAAEIHREAAVKAPSPQAAAEHTAAAEMAKQIGEQRAQAASELQPAAAQPQLTPSQRVAPPDKNVAELRTKITKLVQSRFGGSYKNLFDHYGKGGAADKVALTKLFEDADIGNVLTRGMWADGVMGRVDANHDGRISWDEFAAVVDPQPGAPVRPVPTRTVPRPSASPRASVTPPKVSPRADVDTRKVIVPTFTPPRGEWQLSDFERAGDQAFAASGATSAVVAFDRNGEAPSTTTFPAYEDASAAYDMAVADPGQRWYLALYGQGGRRDQTYIGPVHTEHTSLVERPVARIVERERIVREKTGLSGGAKIALGVAGLAAALGIGYAISRGGTTPPRSKLRR
jgi:hypothetical protein